MNKSRVGEYKNFEPELYSEYMAEQPLLQRAQSMVEDSLGDKILKQRRREEWHKEQMLRAETASGLYERNPGPNSAIEIIRSLGLELQTVWGEASYKYNMLIGKGEIRPIIHKTYKELFEIIQTFTKKYYTKIFEIYTEIQRIIKDLEKMEKEGFLDLKSDTVIAAYRDYSRQRMYGDKNASPEQSIIGMISDLEEKLHKKREIAIRVRGEKEEDRKERVDFFERVRGQFIPKDPNDPRFPRGVREKVKMETESEKVLEEGEEEAKRILKNFKF